MITGDALSNIDVSVGLGLLADAGNLELNDSAGRFAIVRDDVKKESILGWSSGGRLWERGRTLLLFGPVVAFGDDGRLEDINGYVIKWGSGRRRLGSSRFASHRRRSCHNTITSFSAARARLLPVLSFSLRIDPDSEKSSSLSPHIPSGQ